MLKISTQVCLLVQMSFDSFMDAYTIAMNMERQSQAPQAATRVATDVAFCNRRGLELMDSGRYYEAVNWFDRALRLQADNFTLWYNRGDALAHLTRYADALASFEQAIALNPASPAAWTYQGVMLIYLTRYAEALLCCDQAIALNPKDLEAWTFRGVALQRLGQYKQAYVSYNKATQETPRSWQQSVTQLMERLTHHLRSLKFER